MSVLSDRWIKKMALEKEMIKPFVAEQKRAKRLLTSDVPDKEKVKTHDITKPITLDDLPNPNQK